MSGKWEDASIPKRNWRCVGIYDVKENDSEALLEICEMCETAEIRYIHTMHHDHYPTELDVGCICAGHMEGDTFTATKREADFKSRLARRDKWLTRKWRVSQKGNAYLNTRGFNVVVYRLGSGWVGRVSKGNINEPGPTVKTKLCATQREAKLAAFDKMQELAARSV